MMKTAVDAAKRKPPETIITPEHPLIILQTSPRFGDSDDEPARGDRLEEAAKHGREVARVWRETVPEDIKPFCQLQIEIRTHDHEGRYQTYRRLLDETEEPGVPTSLQITDPHDEYTFDPLYVEKLLQEYPSIKSIGLTESRLEHYHTFNVPRYAVSPDARYAMDCIKMAAKYGKHVSMSYQSLKWMHVGCDVLNAPLVETIREYGEYCLPQNEHLGPQHLPRQTSTWGFWIVGFVENWGVEPQSWWFENGRMLEPGLFGQDPDNTRACPPLLYRAMILEGAKMGATVYQFEPFWDLFDYDNARCWRDVIYPTLMEVIDRKLIPKREQVLEKTKVAYHLKSARDINEFHENLRDVDWITEEGYLARAAYGLWQRFLEHELIPNKGQHYYIPLLPPVTPKEILDHFEVVFTPGACDSVEAYEAALAKHYTPDGEGTACIMSINDHTYVMQSHENLYEVQTYAVHLPKSVRGITGEYTEKGIRLEWPADDGASTYHVLRAEGLPEEGHPPDIAALGDTTETSFLDATAEQGRGYAYSVTATTRTVERREGAVNYLDYLIFSQTESVPAELVVVDGAGDVKTELIVPPEDDRPASQVVFPTFDGAEGENESIAREIVARFEAFRAAYEEMDWRKVIEFYSARYEDPNGFHREYAGRAWKWYFTRHNTTCLLRQIRRWDFNDYDTTGEIRVRMFSLFRALRRDDRPFGYGWDGSCRIPRTRDEEVVYTWVQEEDHAWRIICTDPAVPNFHEILWLSRGADKKDLVLRPGKDD